MGNSSESECDSSDGRPSVFSVETRDSTASYSSSVPWGSALKELLSLLMNDINLQPLFVAASQKSSLKSDSFQNISTTKAA